MGDIVLAGSTSGTTTLTPTAVSGTTTLTLPATTDTLVGKTTTDTLTNKTLTSPTITGASITVASTAAPTFSAYANTAQATSSNVPTKILFQVESWDTNNNFASSRFTPTVAGYYLLSCELLKDGSPTRAQIMIWKNGGGTNNEFVVIDITASAYVRGGGSVLLYANGSTDYFEVYGTQIGGTGFTYSASQTTDTSFTGAMIRSA